jgi:hypothetical protein
MPVTGDGQNTRRYNAAVPRQLRRIEWRRWKEKDSLDRESNPGGHLIARPISLKLIPPNFASITGRRHLFGRGSTAPGRSQKALVETSIVQEAQQVSAVWLCERQDEKVKWGHTRVSMRH